MIDLSMHQYDLVGLRAYRPDSDSDGRDLVFEGRNGNRKHITLFPAFNSISDDRTGAERWSDVDRDDTIEEIPEDAPNGKHMLNIHGVKKVDSSFTSTDDSVAWTDYRFRVTSESGKDTLLVNISDFI
jgi:hypothetical protein